MKSINSASYFMPQLVMGLLLYFSLTIVLIAQTPLSTPLQYIQKNHKQYGLTKSDLNQWIITDQYTSKHNGITHTYLQQTYNEIPVYNAMMNINSKADGTILNIGNRFIPNLKQQVTASKANLTQQQALIAALQHLDIELKQAPVLKETIGGIQQKVVFDKGSMATEDINVQLIYQPILNQQVKLCWEASIYEVSKANWWQIRVDAQTGEILDKNNWVVQCHWGITDEHTKCTAHHHHHHQLPPTDLLHRNWGGQAISTIRSNNQVITMNMAPQTQSFNAKQAPNQYEVFAMPIESPMHGNRTIVTAPWNNALNASPFGWHDTNGASGAEYTITRGNNVWAQDDQDGDNSTFGVSPDGGATLEFNFPLNLNANPSTYLDPATTNMFYWCNVMHDVWYQYGFDEVSGNFQQNNYGNGGGSNDPVVADVQDGSATNNARFLAAPDGSAGRIEMYEWVGGVSATCIVNSPTSVSGGYGATGASFGPNGVSVTGNVVMATPNNACSAITNAAAINGNIALVDRGNCNFTDKVQNAQNAGAIAVLVCNNVSGAPFTMGGTDPGTINIPSIMITQSDCATIRAQIPTVNMTINVSGNFNKDGDFDNGIIAHEYGHGISIRLTGGGGNASCLTNDEQMGEGWSDWFGLMLTIENGDAGTDARPVGTYAQSQPNNGSGIRPHPYSTDMGVNPHTYGNIGGQAIPHGVGSVWAAMIWDLSWALIDQYGYDPDVYNGTGGNNIAMQLVIDGCKLQPCNPGFIDGRDAILLADQVNYGGANECLIWEVFARRGLGFSADQGSSNSTTDGTEAFDLPPVCSNTILINKTAASATVATGATLTYTVNVQNNTGGTANNVNVTDNLPNTTNYVNGSANCSANEAGGNLTLSLGNMANGASQSCNYQISVPANHPFTSFYFEDDIESGTNNWTVGGSGSVNWATTSSRTNSGNTAWFAANIEGITDQYLVSDPVTLGSGAELRFWHFYNTETTWDGGVVEISTNGGSSWTDLGNRMTQNGYNEVIQNNDASAISTRAAFSGNSGVFVQTIVDLSTYNGQNVQIRFRFASDEFVGADGWYIDDVQLLSPVEIINQACVSSGGINECTTVSTLVVEGTGCTPITWYADTDSDGFGDPNNTTSSCTQPAGFVNNNTDCNDNNNQIHPNATEVCDGVDNNCVSGIDEGVQNTYYQDADNDGFGDPNNSTTACSQPTGFVNNNTDCNDNDALEQPNQIWYQDADADGFGNGTTIISCTRPFNYYTTDELINPNTDCDDTNNQIHPNATEVCDGADNNCINGIDEGVLITYYRDADRDGFGNPLNSLEACSQPIGFVTNPNDCNDNDRQINPDATEICDDIDNNCNNVVDDIADGSCTTIANVTVFLQGVFNTGSEKMNISNSTIVPTNQPYNVAPWFYTGTESVSTLPTNVVDWILVEAVDPQNRQVLETKAVLLLDDGAIISPDGTTGVIFTDITHGEAYYLNIRHRNHIDITTSKTSILTDGQELVDLTKSENILGGDQQGKALFFSTEKNATVFGLHAGDFDGNGIINVADFNNFREELTQSPNAGYDNFSDCDLNGVLTVDDFNCYKENASQIGVSSIRY